MSRQSASRLRLYLLRIITVTITYYGDATSFTFCRACAKGGRVIVIFLIQHGSRVLADGGNVFLRKPIRARVFASTPGSPRGSRRRRMGNDHSVQIAATSSGRRRALARMWRGERASGREMVGGIVVPVGAAPIARNRKSAWRPTRKFSALQSIENPQNAERISILREPSPHAGIAAPTRKERRALGTLTIPAL
jgi:hypothetical protein